MRGSKKKIGRGDRPVCNDRRERRSGDADFVLAGGVRAEPSHPRTTERKMSRSDALPLREVSRRGKGKYFFMIIYQSFSFASGRSARNPHAKKELAFAAPSGQVGFGTCRSGASNERRRSIIGSSAARHHRFLRGQIGNLSFYAGHMMGFVRGGATMGWSVSYLSISTPRAIVVASPSVALR